MKRTEKLSELKNELAILPPSELLKIAVRLAKYKVENKELMTYLLFHADDPLGYAEKMKEEVVSPFYQIGISPYHLVKALRKSLRQITKYYKFTSNINGEIELLISIVNCFDENFKREFVNIRLNKLIFGVLEKVEKKISKLHEDLQRDYIDLHKQLLEKTLKRMGRIF
jgi:hypothetical protein